MFITTKSRLWWHACFIDTKYTAKREKLYVWDRRKMCLLVNNSVDPCRNTDCERALLLTKSATLDQTIWSTHQDLKTNHSGLLGESRGFLALSGFVDGFLSRFVRYWGINIPTIAFEAWRRDENTTLWKLAMLYWSNECLSLCGSERSAFMISL